MLVSIISFRREISSNMDFYFLSFVLILRETMAFNKNTIFLLKNTNGTFISELLEIFFTHFSKFT